MNRRPSVVQFLLWIAVSGWAIVFGGLFLETTLIVPEWSGALPESLTTWNIHPPHVFDPTKFYWTFTSATVLATVGLWIAGRDLLRSRRKWLIASSVCAAAGILYTFIYFLPRNVLLFQRHGSGLSAEEIVTLGNHWVVANWLRLTIIGIGFLCALRVFDISSRPEPRS